MVVSQATVGSNVETINYKNLTLEVRMRFRMCQFVHDVVISLLIAACALAQSPSLQLVTCTALPKRDAGGAACDFACIRSYDNR